MRGNASCPTPGALEAALVGLIPSPAAPAAPPDVVEICDQGGSVTVRLSSARGEVIGEKRLPDRLSCGERAQAAAVVVAAWEARLRGVAAEVRAPARNLRRWCGAAAAPAAPRSSLGRLRACRRDAAARARRSRSRPAPRSCVGDLERRRARRELRGRARARGFAAGARARRGDRRRALAGRGVGARRLAAVRRRSSSSTPCRAGARWRCTCTAARR